MSIRAGASLFAQGYDARSKGVEISIAQTLAPISGNIRYPIGKQWMCHNNYVLSSLSTISSITSANKGTNSYSSFYGTSTAQADSVPSKFNLPGGFVCHQKFMV